MRLLTMDQVEALPVVGDGFNDQGLWDAVYRIAMDASLPIKERARAIRHMGVLTGVNDDLLNIRLTGMDDLIPQDDISLVLGYERSLAQETQVDAYTAYTDEHGNNIEWIGDSDVVGLFPTITAGPIDA